MCVNGPLALAGVKQSLARSSKKLWTWRGSSPKLAAGRRAGPRGAGRNGFWARQPGGVWFGSQGGVTEGCQSPKTAPRTGQQRRRGRGGERRHLGGVLRVGGPAARAKSRHLFFKINFFLASYCRAPLDPPGGSRCEQQLDRATTPGRKPRFVQFCKKSTGYLHRVPNIGDSHHQCHTRFLRMLHTARAPRTIAGPRGHPKLPPPFDPAAIRIFLAEVGGSARSRWLCATCARVPSGTSTWRVRKYRG